MSSRIAGVDVGGTFTDLIALDTSSGPTARVRIAKAPTSTDNQAFGVLEALRQAGIDPAELDLVIHGTTTTTNAVLERKIAVCGLVTTRGFRDVLELGRRTRPNPYGMTGEFEPLIPRERRFEVTERMDASGAVVSPLDEAELRAALEALLEQGTESLVIHFLHAYANPAHENRAYEIAREIWPNEYITVGHRILSEFREYERGTTASVNAAVQPVLDRYLKRLQQELAERGYRKDLLVMNGNGGTVSAGIVAAEAAKTVMSGPASGVIAAAATASRAGFDDVISYDMGGTSTDVALIQHGVPEVSSELTIEYGLPVHVPMVDVRTIGAGGGSIGFVNRMGMLQVGPESAGAQPGPICYGRGGARPTTTDANLLLGRLDRSHLLSVEKPVALEEVERIFSEQLGAPLGLSAEEVAEAMLTVANHQMCGAIRMVSLSRGHDPRDFVLFAFGGAGPLHACALARDLGIPRVLVPARPGITNALGCLVSDLRHDFVRTLNTPLAALDLAQLHETLRAQTDQGRTTIAREGVAVSEHRIFHTLDMQFQGQTHLITIELPGPEPDREQIQRLFEETYFKRFAVELPEIRAVVVNAHTAVIGMRETVALELLLDADERRTSVEEAIVERRSVRFDGHWCEAPVYRREWLPLGGLLEGPAIVVQLDTTVVLEPDTRTRVDEMGNLVVEVSPRPDGGRAT